MPSFHEIQAALDRILGDKYAGNHGAFWRGKTRDEFVELEIFGFRIITVGDPDGSNLVLALEGKAPFGADLKPRPQGAIIRRMPAGLPPASDSDIALIREWITDGCPEEVTEEIATLLETVPSDATHVRYWRNIDYFFLPSLSSQETAVHVGRLHNLAFRDWAQSNIFGGDPLVWENYRSAPDVMTSFEYIRTHQTRLIQNYYGSSQDNLFNSIWKFGGNLLPTDPQSGPIPPRRTMNGTRDWFVWIPYLEISMRSVDMSDADLRLARAWHVGIVADGLLRTGPERNEPIPISDFDVNDPNLKRNVFAEFEVMDPSTLIPRMLQRAQDFFSLY